MRNKIQNSLLKAIEMTILSFLIAFFIGCNSHRLTRNEWFNLMEDLRLRKNSLELEKSYLKSVLADSLTIDSLRIKLKKCEEETEKLKLSDTTKLNLLDF